MTVAVPSSAPTTSDLSEANRAALLFMAQKLADGFTGRFEVECHEGGIRCVRTQQEHVHKAGRMVPRGGK